MIFESIDGGWHAFTILVSLELLILNVIPLLKQHQPRTSSRTGRTYQTKGPRHRTHQRPPPFLTPFSAQLCLRRLCRVLFGVSGSDIAAITVLFHGHDIDHAIVLVMGWRLENFALVDYIANGVDGHPLMIGSGEHLRPKNRGISADRCSRRCLRGSGRFGDRMERYIQGSRCSQRRLFDLCLEDAMLTALSGYR